MGLDPFPFWIQVKSGPYNYHALILNSHHGNIKNQLGKEIIPSCKIHMVEEETLGGGPKGGGNKKN